ncbi:MAG: hypothetical protein WB421_19205 [Terriglobales bacterium]
MDKVSKKTNRSNWKPIDLSEFRRSNPWSKVEAVDRTITIQLPWNDGSLELVVQSAKDRREIGCLNALVLPERFNAIYHRDQKRIEYIFSELFDAEEALPSQDFAFRWSSRDYLCHYGPTSERLLFLARVFRPVKGSSSHHRHLDELHDFQLAHKLPATLQHWFKSRKAISFFVENVEAYHEEHLIAFAKHLNFYTAYFDRTSPMIDIVPVSSGNVPLTPGAPRTPEVIPPMITAVELDPFLLDLNLAARMGEIRLRFLYYYQILEYAGFYWVEDSVKTAICKILQAPDLQSNLDEYVPKLLDALVPTRQNDEHKIKRVIESRVDPKVIWTEISCNLPHFCVAHKFEGGFQTEPLVSIDTTEEAFSKMWNPKVFDTLRAIRNSLVHARESRTEAVIFPTVANARLLRPWIPVARRMAEQVTIYDR